MNLIALFRFIPFIKARVNRNPAAQHPLEACFFDSVVDEPVLSSTSIEGLF
jgi:hypothetical protein